MSKLSVKLFLRSFNADQKCVGLMTFKEAAVCKKITYSKYLAALVIMNETWVHYDDPEAKELSKQWKNSSPPRSKKLLVEESTGNFLLLFSEINMG